MTKPFAHIGRLKVSPDAARSHTSKRALQPLAHWWGAKQGRGWMSDARGSASSQAMARVARLCVPWYALSARLFYLVLNPRVSRRAHALNLTFAAGDVAEAYALTRIEGSGAAWRLPLHVADEVVFTGVVPSRYATSTSVPRVPLALESTMRWGAAGLLVPATGGFAVRSLLRRLGVAPRDTNAWWPMVAAGAGFQTRMIRSRRLVRAEAQHVESLSAEASNARLVGQHSIAMGADSIVDQLVSLAPLLGTPPADTALGSLLDGWKAALATEGTTGATYLGTALVRWEQSRNLDPDLSARVILTLAAGDGAELITGEHVVALANALEALDLCGPHAIQVVRSGTPRESASSPIELRVGTATIHLSAPGAPPLTDYDPTPAGFAVGAATLLFEAGGDWSAVPLPFLIPPALAYAVAAWWSHDELSQAGTAPTRTRARIVTVAAMLGAASAAIVTGTQRRHFTDFGLSYFGGISNLESAVTIAAFSWDRITPVDRGRIAAIVAAGITISFALSARPRSLRSLAVELASLAASFVAWRGLPTLIEEEARTRAETMTEADRTTIGHAHEEGRAIVFDLVSSARDDAATQFAALRHTLPGDLGNEVQRRLVQIDRRLEELRCQES